jgi:hypothetical protein
MPCKHSPDPKTYRDPTPIGSTPSSYIVRLTVNCVKCGATGEAYAVVTDQDTEWEAGQ